MLRGGRFQSSLGAQEKEGSWGYYLALFLGFVVSLILQSASFYHQASSYLPDPFVFLACLSIYHKGRGSVLIFVWVWGFVQDAYFQTPLGIHSLFYIIFCYLFLIFRQRLYYYSLLQRLLALWFAFLVFAVLSWLLLHESLRLFDISSWLLSFLIMPLVSLLFWALSEVVFRSRWF